MGGRRRDNADGVARLSSFLNRVKRADIVLVRQLSRDVRCNVIETDEIRALCFMQFGINPHVLLAKRAGADDGHFNVGSVGEMISRCHASMVPFSLNVSQLANFGLFNMQT